MDKGKKNGIVIDNVFYKLVKGRDCKKCVLHENCFVYWNSESAKRFALPALCDLFDKGGCHFTKRKVLTDCTPKEN